MLKHKNTLLRWCTSLIGAEHRLLAKEAKDHAEHGGGHKEAGSHGPTAVDATKDKTRSAVDATMNADAGKKPATPAPAPAPTLTQEHPSESAEHAAERAAHGRTFEQQAQQPGVEEAALIGAGVSAIPATAAISLTLPQLVAAGAAPTAAFTAPILGGAWLGHNLGQRLGHPYMGTAFGVTGGTAAGYGVLASAPLLASGVAGVNTGMAATAAAVNPWLLSTGGLGLGAGLGYMIGNSLNKEYGGYIGAPVGAAAAGIPLFASTYATGSVASVLNPLGLTAAFIAAPAALGGLLGYKLIGGRNGAIAGTVVGGGVGATALTLGLNSASVAGISSLASTALWPAAGLAAAGVGTYGFGKFHQWLWGTPDNVGTWGMLKRGAIPTAAAVGTAVASAAAIGTLPAIVAGVGAAAGGMVALRGLTAIHDRLWHGTWNAGGSTYDRALTTLLSPVTIPAGIIKHTWDGTIGALFRGFKGDKYKPKFDTEKQWWNPLAWTEKLLSLPGRVLRGGVSTGASVAKASTWGVWKHLWADDTSGFTFTGKGKSHDGH